MVSDRQHPEISPRLHVKCSDCTLQVIVALAVRPPKTSMLRRSWNLLHWTLGRSVLALAIANIFIGCFLSHVKHSHIAAQATILGGLFIIYMLKNQIEYMLIKHTPEEEERLLAAINKPGMLSFARLTYSSFAAACMLRLLNMYYSEGQQEAAQTCVQTLTARK